MSSSGAPIVQVMATAAAPSSATPRGSTAPVVTPLVAPAGPMPSLAHRHSGAVSDVAAAAAASAPGGVVSAARESGTNNVSVSAYVGHDQLISNVFGNSDPSSVPDEKPEAVAAPADVEGDPVSRLVVEKKRKFHSGRLLELKNLPDGCTEQVGNHSGIYRDLRSYNAN